MYVLYRASKPVIKEVTTMRKKTIFLLSAMLLILAGCAENAPAPQSKALNVSAYETTQPDAATQAVIATQVSVVKQANAGTQATVGTQADVTTQADKATQVTAEPQKMLPEVDTAELTTMVSPDIEEAPAIVAPTLPELVAPNFSLNEVPPYAGAPYTEVHNNVPFFTDTTTTAVFELYSPLDELGRCGVAFANICPELMPTESRGSIGMIKPSGWQTVKYNDLIDGNYLYNRCHLIAYSLASENANELNLITGTRYLNTQGMLPFENLVANYVSATGNHVLYRSTPIFEGRDLVARGVLMEGYSVEDSGRGVSFCVFCYNVQPGIEIDYATGDSRRLEEPSTEPVIVPIILDDIPTVNDPNNAPVRSNPLLTPDEPETTEPATQPETQPATEPVTEPVKNTPASTHYVVNTNTKKFHYPNCSSVDQMKEKNRWDYTGSREDLIRQNYEPCKRCNP